MREPNKMIIIPIQLSVTLLISLVCIQCSTVPQCNEDKVENILYEFSDELLSICKNCINVITDSSYESKVFTKLAQETCPLQINYISNASLSKYSTCSGTVIINFTNDSEEFTDLFIRSQNNDIARRITQNILVFGHKMSTLESFEVFIDRAGLQITEVIIKPNTISFNKIQSFIECDKIQVKIVIWDVTNKRLLFQSDDYYLNQFNGSLHTSLCTRSQHKQGKKINISLFNCPPFVVINPKSKKIEGIDMYMIEEITKGMQVNFIISNKWAGVLNDVSNGTAEIGACSQWISSLYQKKVIPSIAYGELTTKMFVPKPQKISQALTLITPFDATVWITYLCMLILTNIFAVLSAKYISKIGKTKKINLKCSSIDYSIWSILRTSLQTAPNSFPTVEEVPMRWIGTSWIIINMICSIYYTTFYSNHMMFPLYSPRIQSFEDMIQSNISWGQYFEKNKLFISSNDPILNELSKQFIDETSSKMRLGLLETYRHAIVARVWSERFILADDDPQVMMHIQNEMISIKQRIMTYSIALVLQENSLYNCIVNKKMYTLIESGIIDKITKILIENTKDFTVIPLNNEMTSESQVASSLSSKYITGAIFILVVGIILGTLVLIIELIMNRIKTT